jgi:hypothetical protein
MTMTKFVALHNQNHQPLRVNPSQIEVLGAQERMVPVVISEFLKLIVDYPLVFTKSADTGRFICVALLGFDDGENLFWQDNRWNSIYVPLNIQRQPFFIGKDNDRTLVCIDIESSCLTSGIGDALFTPQGEETLFLQQIKAKLAELVNGELQTQEFIQWLMELKLIMPLSLDITFANQKTQRVQGIYTIDEEKLSALSREQWLDLQERGYAKPIYTMIASMGQLYALIDKKNKRNT